MTIDRDRDYLLSVIIDLNTTLAEYKNELARQLDNNAKLVEQKASLTEANAQALANAEGWRKATMRWSEKYEEIADALGKKWGDEKQEKFLRKLGHISD